jgi:hypothetical protein
MNETHWNPGSAATPAANPVAYLPGSSELPDRLVPDGGYAGAVVLLLDGSTDRDWASAAAIEIAAAWADAGRRVVLSDLHLEEPLLHDRLAEENADGIVDIFLYGASVARSARPPAGQPFYLIPAGTYTARPEDVYRHPRWTKLAAGFKDANATLLLFAPADAPGVDALSQHTTAAVVLGRGGGRPFPVPSSSLLAVLVPPGESTTPIATIDSPDREQSDHPPEQLESESPTDDARWEEGEATVQSDSLIAPSAPAERDAEHSFDAAPDPTTWTPDPAEGGAGPLPVSRESADVGAPGGSDADRREPVVVGAPAVDAPGSTVATAGATTRGIAPARRRKRHSGPAPLIWLLIGAGLLVGIAAAAAIMRPELFRGLIGAPAPSGPDGRAAGSIEPLPPGPAPRALADTLPYVVQVRAFRTLDAARAELPELQQRFPAEAFYIVPELTQGVLYYKVMAGILPDTASAFTLRGRLVEAGFISPADARSDGPRTWSLIQLRPFTFAIDEFESRTDASAAADALADRGIPTYPASIPYSDGSERWRLYGGAYAEPVHAEEMRQLLVDADLPAQLVIRVSRPPSDDP